MGKVLTRQVTPSEALRAWTIQDSAEMYNLPRWGMGFFGINERGHIAVSPRGPLGPSIDLKELVDQLQQRGILLPILIRFSDILRARIEQINSAFAKAIEEHNYRGQYMGVYPIKVNQQRHVVEEIVHFGTPYRYGLEAGSKPELLAVLGLQESNAPLVICNGYKDEEYIDMVLLATKLGKTIIPVVEKFSELELIARRAKALGVRPHIGVRLKLSARGAGRWQESAGDRSKFGLTVTEIVTAIEFLRSHGMLDCLELIHFHIGSQISNIRSIKEAMAEACRMYVEVVKSGAALQYLDVGGGMAVDYDGSSSNFPSSANYTMQEYASDIVAMLYEACEKAEVEHPNIVTECGRAITAHHSVLVFNVIGAADMTPGPVPKKISEDAPDTLRNLLEVHNSVTRKNFQEAYHDAVHLREESISLFNLGFLSLEQRSVCETIFWAICQKILRILRDKDQDYIPDELEGLEAIMADTYFCNFSAFQSMPDFWAVQQLFPIVPIHRLNEEPTRRAILADITCDSDGKVDKFIDLRDVKEVLELHTHRGEPYLVGVFMVGAYQEILGDMHNLFGDTNAVHVVVDDDGGYRMEHVVAGDTVEEVLRYVQYTAEDLIARLRRTLETSVREKRISLEESAAFLQRYERGMKGYTYLGQ
ncbi:MAG: biosynthetic arginine decarboxylase [Phycisphaerae bacterium]|nr:biosynthetic arginine decarboxylase [Phycisphaerae bacterium]